MLERIDGLPADVWGLRATGEVRMADYDRVVLPALQQARREGRRIRFLYHIGPEFERFTAGAAWEDMRVGLHYMRLFERCAVVTDVNWLRSATLAFAPLMPCPVRVFSNAALQEAVDWLASPLEANLSHRILPVRRVLLVEPRGRLRAEDFDALAASVDAWADSVDGALEGVVVHARKFPGWENVGSLLRHVLFVRDYHRKVHRIAVASDSAFADIAQPLAELFVAAEIKRFHADDLDQAIRWASGRDRPHEDAA